MHIPACVQCDRRVCTQIGCIHIIKRRSLSGDVFPSARPLNPSYAFVYLFATFQCLLLTCVNQSCESEWCVDSHASVSIWLSQQLKGEMPEPMPLDKWAGSAVAGLRHYLLKACTYCIFTLTKEPLCDHNYIKSACHVTGTLTNLLFVFNICI